MAFSRKYFKTQRRILARNVKDIRMLKNISLDALHAQSGVSLLHILHIEQARGQINFETLCRLALDLNVPPARLLRE